LLFGIAPPIDRYDFSVLLTSTLPKFIVHGENDELISIKDIRRFYAQLPEPKELVVIEDADHLFDGKTSLVGEAVEDLLGDFNA
jgi:alpha/beta superfamily hydrolase